MLNRNIGIKLDKYDAIAKSIAGYVVVTGIKTKRQRKYRNLNEFYNEINNIKSNEFDELLDIFSRDSNFEMIENSNAKLKKLGIAKEDVIKAYRSAIIERIRKKEFKWVSYNEVKIWKLRLEKRIKLR